MPPLTLPLIMRLRTQSRDAVSGNLELEDFGNILLESGDAAVQLEPGDSIYSMPKWGGRYLSSRTNPAYTPGEIYFVNGQMYAQTATAGGFAPFTARRLALQSNGSFVGAIYTQDSVSDTTGINGYTTKTISDSQYVYGIQTRDYAFNTSNSSFIRRYFKTLFVTNVPTPFAVAETIRFTSQAVYDAIVVADDTTVICGMDRVGGTYRQYLGILQLNQFGVFSSSFNVLTGTSSSTQHELLYNSLAYDPASGAVFYGGGVTAGAEFGRVTVSGTTISHAWRFRFSGLGSTKVMFADGFLYTLTGFSTGAGNSAILELRKFSQDGAGVTELFGRRISATAAANFDQFFLKTAPWGVTYHPMGRLIVWGRAFINGSPGTYVASFTLDGNLVWERGVFYAPSSFSGTQAVEINPADGAIIILMGDGQYAHIVQISYDGTPLRNPGPNNFSVFSTPATHSTSTTSIAAATALSSTTFSGAGLSNGLTVNSDNGVGSYSLTTF